MCNKYDHHSLKFQSVYTVQFAICETYFATFVRFVIEYTDNSTSNKSTLRT